MSFGDFSNKVFRGGNILDWQAKLARKVRTLSRNALAPLDASMLEGDLTRNRFIAQDEEGRIRMIMSAISLLDDYGIDAHFLGMDNDGNPQVWINATDGSLGAAGGAYKIDAEGQLITGINFLTHHSAEYEDTIRRARQGFQVVNGALSYVIEFIDDSPQDNLITVNPGLEDGDNTGHTLTGGFAVSGASPISGVYSSRLYTSNPGSGTATHTTDKYAVSVGNKYKFSVLEKTTGNGAKFGETWTTELIIEAKWYDGSSSLLKTDLIFTGMGTQSVNTRSAVFQAPAGVTQAEIKVTANFTKAGGSLIPIYCYLDNFEISLVPDYAYVRLADGKVYAGNAEDEIDIFAGSDARVLDNDVTATEVVNTTSETNIWSYTLPGGTLGTDGMLKLDFDFSHLNNTAQNRISTVQVYLGATGQTVYNENVGPSASRNVLRGSVIITGDGATNAQRYTSRVTRERVNTGGAVSSAVAASEGTYAINTAADATVKITITHSAQSASLSVVKKSVTLTYIPTI